MRYELPDKIKFIAIILVLAGHLTFPQCLMSYIYCFHMPLFFILSGAFIKKLDSPATEYISRQFKRLVLPYFIFGFILIAHYLIYSLFQKYGRMDLDFRQIFMDFAWGKLSVLWFLSALFCASILYFFLRKISTSPAFILTSSFAVAVCAGFALYGKEGFWCFNIALVALFYFSLGKFIARICTKDGNIRWKNALNSRWAPLAGIVLSAAAFFICPYNLPYEMATMRFGNPLLYIPISLVGCAGVALLAKVVPYCTVVKWIASNTLTIFCTHLVVYSWCRGALKIFLSITYPEHFNTETLLFNIFLILAALVAALPIKYCLNKIFPAIIK